MRVFVRDVVGDTQLVECSPDANAGALKAGSLLSEAKSVAPILRLKNGVLLQATLETLQMHRTRGGEVFN